MVPPNIGLMLLSINVGHSYISSPAGLLRNFKLFVTILVVQCREFWSCRWGGSKWKMDEIRIADRELSRAFVMIRDAPDCETTNGGSCDLAPALINQQLCCSSNIQSGEGAKCFWQIIINGKPMMKSGSCFGSRPYSLGLLGGWSFFLGSSGAGEGVAAAPWQPYPAITPWQPPPRLPNKPPPWHPARLKSPPP